MTRRRLIIGHQINHGPFASRDLDGPRIKRRANRTPSKSDRWRTTE